MKDQIIEMLSNGIKPTHVASALGLDHQYISQVLAENENAQIVAANIAARSMHLIEHDKKIDEAEEEALRKVTTLIPFVTKMSDAVSAFRTLNGARRVTPGVQGDGSSNGAQTVIINLPAAAVANFTLSQDKQVVDVDGRSMVTMPAKSLAQRLEARNAQRLLSVEVPASLEIGGKQVQSLVASKL